MAPQQMPQVRRAPAPELTEQDRDDNRTAPIGSEEDALPGRGATQPLDQNPRRRQEDPEDVDRPRREPTTKSPADDIRSRIAARFRRDGVAEGRPFNGDMRDPENVYGEHGRAQNDRELDDDDYDAQAEREERQRAAARPAPQDRQPQPRRQQPAPVVDDEDDDDLDPSQILDLRDPAIRAAQTGEEQDDRIDPEYDPSQRMITRTVNGKKVTLSEAEWLDRASKIEAADMYLQESRDILKQAKEIRKGQSPAAPDRQNPDGQNGQQHPRMDARDENDDQNPGPTFKDVIEKIQYGDPEEAARDLERIVDSRSRRVATAQVNEGAIQRSFDQDLKRSQKALKAFSDANPDLANDEIAAIAIENGMYKLYREDMVALGLDESQLPKTPQELANWHRFYRVNGYEVRSTTDLLNESKTRFMKWRGDGGQQQTRRSRQAEPSIRVNVNRDDRRMAIPSQPTRAVAPRRDVTNSARQTGSDVVANMRRQRGQSV